MTRRRKRSMSGVCKARASRSAGSVDLSGAATSYGAVLDLAARPRNCRCWGQGPGGSVRRVCRGVRLLHGVADAGRRRVAVHGADRRPGRRGRGVREDAAPFSRRAATGWAGEQLEVRVGVLRLTPTGATEVECRSRSTSPTGQRWPPRWTGQQQPGGGGGLRFTPGHLDFWRALLAGSTRTPSGRDRGRPGLLNDHHRRRGRQRCCTWSMSRRCRSGSGPGWTGALVADGAVGFAGAAGLMLPLTSGSRAPCCAGRQPSLDAGAGDGSTVVLRRGPGGGRAFVETARGSWSTAWPMPCGPTSGWLVSWPGGADGDGYRCGCPEGLA